MEKPIIIGGAETEKEGVKETITKEQREGLKPYRREKNKTPEDEEFINLANIYLQKELDRLGIDFEPIAQEKIHILDWDSWFDKFPGDNKHGHYDHISDTALINTFDIETLSLNVNVDERLKRFATILHEMIHIAGHSKFQIRTDGALDSYRMGYSTIEHDGKEELFKGLNEAVTEGFVMRILLSHKDELEKEFGEKAFLSDEEHLYAYEYYIKMLGLIITDIAVNKDENPKIVQDRLFKGYFTGEMMHLRDIEKTYGKDGLRVIAQWGKGGTPDEQAKITNTVVRYLKAKNQTEKEALVQEILK